MGNTSYRTLCDIFFDKIKDYDFASLDEDVAYDTAISYIAPACLMFENCTQDLSDRDEILQEFNIELTSNNLQILTNFMVIHYITVNFITPQNSLKARLNTSDFHALKLDTMLNRVLDVRATLLSENEQLATNKSFSPDNSGLFNIRAGMNYSFGKKV